MKRKRRRKQGKLWERMKSQHKAVQRGNGKEQEREKTVKGVKEEEGESRAG